jgi:hypothetical protein
MNGLHHLVEAATALTQLVSSVPPNQNKSGRSSTGTHTISDDEESSKKGFSGQSNEQVNSNNNTALQTQTPYSHVHNSNQLNTVFTSSTPNTLVSAHGSSNLKQEPVPDVNSGNGLKNKDSPSLSSGSTLSTTTSAVSTAAEAMNTSPSTTNNPCQREIFPQRLMHILSDTSITDIITWLPHGRSFVIVQPEVLAEKILPKYFPESCTSSSNASSSTTSSCKYPSFTRKLNRWGFRQVTRGPDSGAFHHKFFRRDDPTQCRQMICQRSRRRKVDDKRSAVVNILPRNASSSTSMNVNSLQGHAQIHANVNGHLHHPNLQPSLPRTVTETGAMLDNHFSNVNAAVVSNMPINVTNTNRSRPLPTIQNYRMYPQNQTNAMPNVNMNMNMNVDPNIVSTTASPTPKKDLIMPGAGSNRVSAPPNMDISTLKNSVPRGHQLPLQETQTQQSLEVHALLQHKLAMNAVLAASATAALKRQQQQVQTSNTEMAAPAAATASALFNPSPTMNATNLMQQLEGHIALNPSLSAMIPHLNATFNSNHNQLLPMLQSTHPVGPPVTGTGITSITACVQVPPSSTPSSRASPSTIASASAPSTAATSPITAPGAASAKGSVCGAPSSGDESVRSSPALEGNKDKSDAQTERIESAKSLLYNAYLKALG